jgi:hypothetical protein
MIAHPQEVNLSAVHIDMDSGSSISYGVDPAYVWYNDLACTRFDKTTCVMRRRSLMKQVSIIWWKRVLDRVNIPSPSENSH